MTRIIIGGDVCPEGKIEEPFIQGRSEIIFNDLLPIFESADFNIINLECPLIEKSSPIDKDGGVLGANHKCVNGLKNSHIHATSLANNHILDHGEQGLKVTIRTLNGAGIHWFGAGKDIEEAGKPLVEDINGLRFGFFGVTDYEFSIAGEEACGANPIDLIATIETIKKYRSHVDYLILFFHGGKEHYPFPTPKLQRLCRFIIDQGVDIIILQHSHCAGSYEIYNGKPIIYGQGNLIFEKFRRKIATQYLGFLISLEFSYTGIQTSFIPYQQSKGSLGARRIKPEEEREFLVRFEERSRNILSSEFVEKNWLDLCRKEKYLYASRLRGHNKVFRFLNRKTHFTDWLHTKKSKMIQRNVVECEIHREGLESLWNDKFGNF